MTKNKKPLSMSIGTVRGIPIRIHFTFFILLGWLLLDPTAEAHLSEALFVILIFCCVLLHELGHALVAHRFSIQTRDITLYPFGGIASITTQPEPKAEFFIAIAGPLVNVIIALILFFFVEPANFQTISTHNLPFRLFVTNIALVAFNLLPALPMDGGRVLRAVLSLLEVKNATKIAARISQGLCVILGIAALFFGLPVLFIISLIIFLGAMQEYLRAETKAIAKEFSVAEAMIPRERLESFQHGTTISGALPIVLTSWQSVFPIMSGQELFGVVLREDILTFAASRSDDYIGEITTKSLPSIDIGASLVEAYQIFERQAFPVIQVNQDSQYRGLLVQDRIPDLIFMQEIRQKILPKDEDEIDWPITP